MMMRSVFPRPRREVRPSDFVTLVMFGVLFGVVCVGAVLMDWVVYMWPVYFWLMGLGVWVWWMDMGGFSGVRGWRKHAVLLARLSLLGLFVVMLAEPRMVRKDDSLAVLFLLDHSQSIPRETQQDMKKFMTRIAADKPEKDQVGVLTFAQGAVVELPPAETFPFEGFANDIVRDGTNLEDALSLASAILPDDKPMISRGKLC